MAKWDKEYLKLCKKILTEGVEVENRTGINTLKIPSYNFLFDLQEEFPVLTTKQLFFKNAITEILWIYREQSNDVRWLQERKNHIWDEWMVDEDGIYRIYEPNKNDETVFDKDKEVDLYDLDGNIMLDKEGNKIKVKGIIEGKNIKAAKFYGKEWDVTDGYLNLSVHQRSCDVPLGLPFNVTQYATLLCLIAHCTNLKPGKISWSIKDAHIYVNQIEGIKEQILRGETLEDLEAPELWINEEIDDFFEFDNSRDLKDIRIRKYKHHGKINFPLAQ